MKLSSKQYQVAKLLQAPSQSHITEVFYGGAAGGGKTFLIAHWQIARRLRYPGTRGFIGRESLKNLKLTTFNTFCDVWDEVYRDNPNNITWKVNWMTNTINFSNGSEIVLMDLGYYPSDPEYHRLGSLEITDACIDELPEIKQKCFEILMSRIRYKLEDVGGVPKCLATGNPSMNWVKQRYIKDLEGNPVKLQRHQAYVRATVHDNPDEVFKATYIEALNKLSPNDRLRLLEGEWDISINDNPWAWALNRDKHYTPALYEVNLHYNLELSFDFNHDPCVVVVAQQEPHLPRYNIIGYYRASSSHESALKQLCDRIRGEYIHHANTRQIVVTGDASGTAKDPSRPSNLNRYTDICNYLGLGYSAVKIEKANPPHKASRDLVNAALHQIPQGGLLFWGGRGCELLLSEVEAAYPDSKESLNEYKKKEGGHGLDAFRYLMQLWYAHKLTGARFKDFQRELDAIVVRLK